MTEAIRNFCCCGSALFVLSLLFALALCKSAAMADQAMKVEMRRRHADSEM